MGALTNALSLRGACVGAIVGAGAAVGAGVVAGADIVPATGPVTCLRRHFRFFLITHTSLMFVDEYASKTVRVLSPIEKSVLHW